MIMIQLLNVCKFCYWTFLTECQYEDHSGIDYAITWESLVKATISIWMGGEGGKVSVKFQIRFR